MNFFFAVGRLERGKLSVFRTRPLPPDDGFLFRAAIVDVIEQLFGAEIAADLRLVLFAKLDRSQRGKVLRVLRYLDQLLRRRALRDLDFAFFPHAGNVGLPCLAHAADESVRSAQQQHVRAQRMSASQHAEILQHDGFEERGHQLIRRRAGLLQAVDVRLGKDAALASDLVQLDAVIALVGKLGGGDLELGIDLVDHRSGAAGALVVHGGDLLLAPGLFVIFEDDDLGVLSAQLDDGVHLGMKLLDGKRDGVDLLHKFRADHLGDGSAA